MTALTTDRDTPARSGAERVFPVAASTTIYAGAIVAMNASGYAVPGSTATGLKPVGRAKSRADNAIGDAGDLLVAVEMGVFRWHNSTASDAIDLGDIGAVCYIVDDQTVALTSGSATRSPAGLIADVDDAGVWVLIGPDVLASPSGGLVAANNLSDLASAASARGNLGGGANKVVLHFDAISTKAADAAVVRVVSPVAGTVAKIYSVANAALATGNATLTGKIGATAITDGVITITQSGSAAGDVDSATPTAANTVAVGDVISLTGGGSSTATGTASCLVVITPSA